MNSFAYIILLGGAVKILTAECAIYVCCTCEHSRYGVTYHIHGDSNFPDREISRVGSQYPREIGMGYSTEYPGAGVPCKFFVTPARA